MRRVVGVVFVLIASAMGVGAARAQGVYVGGAVAAEVVRTTSSKSGGATYDNGSGEAFGGAIRVGTFITERVGVELEYFRPGEIESNGGGPFYLAGSSTVWTSVMVEGTTVGGVRSYPTIPSIISQSTRVRVSTTSALLTARQAIGSRVDVVYLGGVGFSRVAHEIASGFSRVPMPLPAAFPIQTYSTRTTQYAAGPVVGVEVRAGMTEHAQVLAGLRLHTLGQSVVDGWMIRPSVGLTWKF
jgi:hypothetical protein